MFVLTLSLIHISPNNAYYLGQFEKDGDEESFYFEITPVSENGTAGEPTNFKFVWPSETNGYEPIQEAGENIALGSPAVSSANCVGDGPVKNLTDGVITLSKWCIDKAYSGYAVIDLGENKAVSYTHLVCDASSQEAQLHLDVTRRLLQDLGCQDRPILPVLNKCDLVPSLQDIPLIGNAVRISAKTGEGIDDLLRAVEQALPVRICTVRLLIPFSQAGLCAELRERANLLSEEFTGDGIRVTAQVDPRMYAKVREFLTE